MLCKSWFSCVSLVALLAVNITVFEGCKKQEATKVLATNPNKTSSIEAQKGYSYFIASDASLGGNGSDIGDFIKGELLNGAAPAMPFLRYFALDSKKTGEQKNTDINVEINKYIEVDIKPNKLLPFALVIRWEKFSNTQNVLTIENKNRGDASDFEITSWKISSTDKVKMIMARNRLIKQVLDYQMHNISLKKSLLLQGIAKYPEKWELGDDGMIKDIKSGIKYSMKTAYQIFSDTSPKHKNYLRAGLEIAAVIGVGKVWYDANLAANQEDWDYTSADRFDIKRIRFDDNEQLLNTKHAYAGSLYYAAARNNGFNSLESYLFALAGSTLWEYSVEYHEVVSINDEIITSVGGAVIGETMFQLSKALLTHKPNSASARIFASILNPVGGAQDALTGNKRQKMEDYGFSVDNNVYLNIFAGIGFVQMSDKNAQAATKFGFEGEVIKLPMNGTGNIKSIQMDTLLSKAVASVTSTTTSDSEIYFLLKNVLAGYHQKQVTMDANQQMRGYNFFVGFAQGMESQSRSFDKDDWVVAVNVLGATMDLTAYYKGAQLRLTIDVFEDFAMVRAHALEKYQSTLSDPVAFSAAAPSVLEKRGYNYGVGPTFRAALAAKYKSIELGIEGSASEWQSLNTLPRFAADENSPLTITDSLTKAKVWIAYLPEKFPMLKFTLSAEHIVRSGQIYDQLKNFSVSESTTDNRVNAQVEFKFL